MRNRDSFGVLHPLQQIARPADHCQILMWVGLGACDEAIEYGGCRRSQPALERHRIDLDNRIATGKIPFQVVRRRYGGVQWRIEFPLLSRSYEQSKHIFG